MLTLATGEAHHAIHVLRLRPGEPVIVLDGAGSEIHCDVQNVKRDTVQLLARERRFVPAPPFRITLIQGLPKGKIIESIIQKATELGAARIVPLLSERATLRLDPATAAQKTAKWQLVAVEAIKQCGAPWLPKIEAPATPAEFLARHEPFDLPIIASLQTGARHARQYFVDFHKKNGRSPASLSIWVGPEGDFTPGESAAILASGALPITLGSLVLRCETAATYCLSILNYELTANTTPTAQ
jgi:16S rRNA (uracil1498-N3)-methyltransferase